MLQTHEPRKITPLRAVVRAILPLVYDDSLSYYEVLCRVKVKLNELISKVNEATGYLDSTIEQIVDEINKFEDETTERVDGLSDQVDTFLEKEAAHEQKVDGQVQHLTELFEALENKETTFESDLSEKFDTFKTEITDAETAHKQEVSEQVQGLDDRVTAAEEKVDATEKKEAAFEEQLNTKFQQLADQLDGDIAEWEAGVQESLDSKLEVFGNTVDRAEQRLDALYKEYTQFAVKTDDYMREHDFTLVQEPGDGEKNVMSQKASTDTLSLSPANVTKEWVTAGAAFVPFQAAWYETPGKSADIEYDSSPVFVQQGAAYPHEDVQEPYAYAAVFQVAEQLFNKTALKVPKGKNIQPVLYIYLTQTLAQYSLKISFSNVGEDYGYSAEYTPYTWPNVSSQGGWLTLPLTEYKAAASADLTEETYQNVYIRPSDPDETTSLAVAKETANIKIALSINGLPFSTNDMLKQAMEEVQGDFRTLEITPEMVQSKWIQAGGTSVPIIGAGFGKKNRTEKMEHINTAFISRSYTGSTSLAGDCVSLNWETVPVELKVEPNELTVTGYIYLDAALAESVKAVSMALSDEFDEMQLNNAITTSHGYIGSIATHAGWNAVPMHTLSDNTANGDVYDHIVVWFGGAGIVVDDSVYDKLDYATLGSDTPVLNVALSFNSLGLGTADDVASVKAEVTDLAAHVETIENEIADMSGGGDSFPKVEYDIMFWGTSQLTQSIFNYIQTTSGYTTGGSYHPQIFAYGLRWICGAAVIYVKGSMSSPQFTDENGNVFKFSENLTTDLSVSIWHNKDCTLHISAGMCTIDGNDDLDPLAFAVPMICNESLSRGKVNIFQLGTWAVPTNEASYDLSYAETLFGDSFLIIPGNDDAYDSERDTALKARYGSRYLDYIKWMCENGEAVSGITFTEEDQTAVEAHKMPPVFGGLGALNAEGSKVFAVYLIGELTSRRLLDYPPKFPEIPTGGATRGATAMK